MEWLPMLAEAAIESKGLGLLGAGLGAGVATVGGARGIGNLVTSALEGQARQPEMFGRLLTTMLIGAALIEGFTFFALAICFLLSR